MKKKLIFLLAMTALLLFALVGCSRDGDATLIYMVDGEEYHKDALEGEDDLFGQIGKEPMKEGHLFGGWYYDEGTWEKPLSYTELNSAHEGKEYRVYAKWETVKLQYNEADRSYTVTGLLLGAGNNVVIPAAYKDMPVVAIADGAFRANTGLSSVKIPDSVKTIGEYAFAECTALTEIALPSSVTSVGRGAFSNCVSLTKATLGTALKTLGADAFFHCIKLSGITLPQTLVEIGARAFASCTELSSITVPFRISHIRAEAFAGTAITELSYAGSRADFEKIDRDDFLNGSSITVIHCTDGDLTP